MQKDDLAPDLRGLFTTDDDGRFWFRTIVPLHYPIPDDGPVGALLRATGRHPYRPAHIHFIAGAAGHDPVTTHLFVEGSPYLDDDTVFGVKESLVRPVTLEDDPETAAALDLPNPFQVIDFDITLARCRRQARAAERRPAPTRCRCFSPAAYDASGDASV